MKIKLDYKMDKDRYEGIEILVPDLENYSFFISADEMKDVRNMNRMIIARVFRRLADVAMSRAASPNELDLLDVQIEFW